ncbi:crotonase/enoyl-CoA hydratase family protein [Microbulbifer bruguierae]|uniref:Crotonase/enoyl-CoA hydratase family protein n=1 Tax=Microbulbifer bruguierae TaxID=3029061 RepID=A0ABY8NCU7_9GAMM|nr:crotonase/enoyl-CoA hydratase family protein [Microbulbifer bruguierae]WGL16525.1 crotonase/enoyl-CoA hydratase family protein [Microbulbifer bruguierae]
MSVDGSQFEYSCFNVSITDHIAHIQLSRPDQMNTMNKAFWNELPSLVEQIDRESLARVIVISSTGKHFSAGMDLSVFSDPKAVPMGGDPGRMGENLRRVVLQLQDSLSSLEKARIPVLVAIHGGCIGGALDMVCAADCRYASQDAFFTIKETELGMTADVGTLQRFPKLVSQGMVRELAYTGRKFRASEAEAMGLVNKVFSDHESLVAGVMDIAAQIAANSPLAVVGCKEMLNYSRDHSVQDSLRYMATWQSGMFRQDDMMKSFVAKSQKEQPTFDEVWPISPLFEE